MILSEGQNRGYLCEAGWGLVGMGMNKVYRKKEVFSVLIWMMVLELCTYVKSHWAAQLRFMHFIIYKLYLNKVL